MRLLLSENWVPRADRATQRGQATLREVTRLVLGLLVVMFVYASPASAQSPAPGWSVDSFATPTVFSKAQNAVCQGSTGNSPECNEYNVTVTQAGSSPADGSTVEIRDVLAPNVDVQRVTFEWSRLPAENLAPLVCTTEGTPVTVVCRFGTGEFGLPPIAPDDTLKMGIAVTVAEGATSAPSDVTVSGGGAPQQSTGIVPTAVDAAPALFGPSTFGVLDSGPGGIPDREAGGHPYEFSTRIDFANVKRDTASGGEAFTSVQDVRDVAVDLPVGFVGSAVATPTCSLAELSAQNSCPTDTEVGHIRTEPEGSLTQINGPIYNVTPEVGLAAEFGYVDALKTAHVIVARVVPGPGGYVLQADAREVPQVPLTSVEATFWGDPVEKSGSHAQAIAMFTNPGSCSGTPLVSTLYMDSWQNPGPRNANGEPEVADPRWVRSSAVSPAVTECNALTFGPGFSSELDSSAADAPTGLNIGITVPQSETPAVRATPPLENATVTLPAGLIVNPAAAGGLAGCSPAQVGWRGGSVANFSPDAPTCPDASKIGSVDVTTPLLSGPLHGSIYLASQNDNPLGALLAAYIVIDDPATGVVVKIPGRLSTDPATGQITGSFDENPQLPFSDLKLSFFGGTRGELATPESCGTFTTSTVLAPWSLDGSEPPASPFDSFSITGGCTPGFAPSFTAGTVSPQAASFSPFVLSFSRQDSEQEISGLTVSLPPGLIAKIAGVGECSDPQIAAAAANPSAAAELASPNCPAASQVGTVQAGAGAGEPLFLSGKAYLTGPYRGAPYGLAVIIPVAAGPFDLGNVVVRSQLRIDPNDADVTAISDPFPTIIGAKGADGVTDGFPIRMRRVDVTLDRPQFTLNPTNCEPLAISAALTSTQGATAAESSRFQAAGCRELPFRPSFSASTQGRASKADGASLIVGVTQKPGEADIHKVDLQLPKALPSRLSTLQKACTLAQFEASPAGCPEGSFIGTATAHTPILGVPLTGPAILVSHGGAAFPDVEFLLQGEGVDITLDGKTDIKNGITYSRFETVPDAPISSFETVLPVGPHSVLGAYVPGSNHYNFCGQRLTLPTTITAQNGAVVTQTTKLGVTGCPPSVAITKTVVKGNSVALTLKLGGETGTVKITGRGLRTTIKRGLKAGTRTIAVPLTAVGRAAKRRHAKLKIQAALIVAGRTGTATATLKT